MVQELRRCKPRRSLDRRESERTCCSIEAAMRSSALSSRRGSEPPGDCCCNPPQALAFLLHAGNLADDPVEFQRYLVLVLALG